MECKNTKIKCVTRIINEKWEELRACDFGVNCSYQKDSGYAKRSEE